MSRPGQKNHNGLFVAPSRTMFVSTDIVFGRKRSKFDHSSIYPLHKIILS